MDCCGYCWHSVARGVVAGRMSYSRILLFLLIGLFGLGFLFCSALNLKGYFYSKAWKYNPETGDREYQEKKPYLVDLAHKIEHHGGAYRPHPYWSAYREFCYKMSDVFEKALTALIVTSTILNLVGL